MASGTHHCKDCGLFFDSSQSHDVHLQYHKENLMSMWMGSDDVKRDSGADSGSDLLQMNSSSATNPINTPVSSVNNMYIKQESNSNLYIKRESKDNLDMEPQPSYIGPSPISPMEYDFKVEPGINSPQSSLISQGPPSGSGVSNYSQPSPSGFYQDFNHHHLQQQQSQNPFSNFPSSYLNGAYDDQFYNRSTANPSRFHPYIGRSPVPTPSPGASAAEVKEERLTPSTPEILDLDSQKVLNSNVSQQNQIGPLPPMWRPHEQFPSPSGSSSVCATPSGLGPSPTSLRPPSTGLGPSPTGLGPSPTSLGQSTGLGPSPTGIGPSPSGIGAPSGGIGLSSGLGISHSSLGPSQMSMLPPMQQPSYGSQHSLPPNHQIISSVSNTTGFPSSNSMSSFYPQGLSVSSGMTNNSSVQYATNPTPSPSSTRDIPPTEYPSNVKRAKSFKCEDCNKWFTSHGHLKRHYNTTLHKNMTKLNGNNPGSNTQSSTTDVTRPPILSPSSKSIGESSTTSSHDEESSLSNTDSLEPSPSTFQPTGSAFQPPPVTVTNYSTQSTPYPCPSSVTLGHINPTLPHYSQAHTFPTEQPLTAPTMYHGHFSTNPATYAPQPPVAGSGSPFFLTNNYICYPQQGGLHGPGFHSMNEYSGPTTVDGYNSFRLDNSERIPHHLSVGDSITRNSPEPAGDTGSEASMDSSESSTTTGATDNYKCNECNKTFNRMCYLTQHRTTYHEGEKPFKCGTCGKRFTDEVIFTDHQGKHAGEKPYKCDVCPKQFNHKTDLRRHMCLHTGEKPFSCEQCGKGFIRKDHMLKHFQTHRKKALAAAANAASSHSSMPPNPPGFPTHPGLPPPHGALPHQTHGPRGHPHVVAPTVY